MKQSGLANRIRERYRLLEHLASDENRETYTVASRKGGAGKTARASLLTICRVASAPHLTQLAGRFNAIKAARPAFWPKLATAVPDYKRKRLSYVHEMPAGTRLDQGKWTADELAAILARVLEGLAGFYASGLAGVVFDAQSIYVEGNPERSFKTMIASLWGPWEVAGLCGAAGMLAPECRHGTGSDIRSDLYSLGQAFKKAARGKKKRHPLSVVLSRITDPDPFRRPTGVEEALRELGAPLPARGPSPGPALLIPEFGGRERVVERLEILIQRSLAGEGRGRMRKARMVQISGRLGIGKTRLLSQLIEGYRERGTHTVLLSCPRLDPSGYEPFRAALSRLWLQSGLPKPLEDQYAQSVQLLVPWLWLQGRKGKRQRVKTALERPGLVEELAQFFVRLSEHAPLVLGIEDMHYMEAPAARLLRHILRDLDFAEALERSPRLFIVATCRTDEAAGANVFAELEDLLEEGVVDRIQLPGLSRDALRSVVTGSAPDHGLRGGDAEAIHKASAGNPFVAREMVRGILARSGETGTGGVQAQDFPETALAVLDGLASGASRSEKKILRVLAVLGRRASLDTLQACTGLAGGRLYASINSLSQRDILRAFAVESHVVFGFCHPMMAGSILGSLPARMRKAIHQKAGEALLDREAIGVEPHVEELAHHFLNGKDPSKGIRFGLEKAGRLRRIHANEQAVETYLKFLPLIDRGNRPDLYREILEKIAELAFITGRFDRAVEYYKTLLELVPANASPMVKAGYYKMTGQAYIKKGDYQKALARFEEGIKTLAPGKGSSLRARLYGLKTYMHLRLGQTREAKAAMRRCLAAAPRRDEDEDLAACYRILGVINRELHNPNKAFEYYQKSLEIHRRLGNLIDVGQLYNNISIIHSEQNDYGKAIKMLGKSIALKKRIGDAKGIVASYINISVISFLFGDHEKALDYGNEALELARTSGFSSDWATTLANLGEMYELLSRYQKGIDHLKRSLRIDERLNIRPSIASSRIRLAKIYTSLGCREAAGRHLNEAFSIAEQIGADLLKAEALTVAADLAGVLNDGAGMKRRIDQASSIYQSLGIPDRELRVRLKAADCEIRFGDTDKASRLIETSIAQAERMRLRYELATAWGLRAELLNKTDAPARFGRLKRALTLAKTSGSPELETKAWRSLGDYYASRGKREEALSAYREGERIVKSVLGAITDPDLKYCFMEHPDRRRLMRRIRDLTMGT